MSQGTSRQCPDTVVRTGSSVGKRRRSYSSASVDQREGAGTVESLEPLRSNHARVHLRQDAQPCTHDNTCQAENGDGMEVSLLTVSDYSSIS
jgi:hypothetical protein